MVSIYRCRSVPAASRPGIASQEDLCLVVGEEDEEQGKFSNTFLTTRMAPSRVTVTLVRAGHPKAHLTVEAATPTELVHAIGSALTDTTDIDAHHLRLIHKGKNITPDDDTVMFKDGAKVTCMLSSKATTARIAAASAPDDRIPSLEYEYERDRMRASISGTSQKKNPLVGAFATFKYPATVALTPSAAAAEELLRSIATDAGIVHVMEKYGWNVGVLSELPPEGYVGVSPVCLLGLNVDKGREIKLRLRTDDMRGFRKRHAIIDTMLHELAHNVVEDHGLEFKQLNSTLRKMYDGWVSGGRSLAGQGAVRTAQEFGVSDSIRDKNAGKGRSAGRIGGGSPSLPPGEAARQAALARSFPILEGFVEKEHVMYYNKQTDEYVDATITAIDRTIIPHSITVDLYANGLDQPATSVGRETEASRLAKKA